MTFQSVYILYVVPASSYKMIHMPENGEITYKMAVAEHLSIWVWVLDLHLTPNSYQLCNLPFNFEIFYSHSKFERKVQWAAQFIACHPDNIERWIPIHTHTQRHTLPFDQTICKEAADPMTDTLAHKLCNLEQLTTTSISLGFLISETWGGGDN